MRAFIKFMRAPLWLKIIVIAVIAIGALVVRDGRAVDFAKGQATAFAQTQVAKVIDAALADAAEAMGLESLDLFGASDVDGLGGAGASDGFVANNGQKTLRIEQEVTPTDWKATATEMGQSLLASPQTIIMILCSLVIVYMGIASVRRRMARNRRNEKTDHKSKYAMSTSVDLPGLDLDAAFADPNAAPDMKKVLGAQQAEAKQELRTTVRAAAKKIGRSDRQLHKKLQKRHSGASMSLFASKQPSAALKEKLNEDPFEKLAAI